MTEDKRKLTRTGLQLAARIDEFRTRRDVICAPYIAARAQVRANEALAGLQRIIFSNRKALSEPNANQQFGMESVGSKRLVICQIMLTRLYQPG